LINVDNSAKPNIKQEADNFCFKYAVCVGRFHDTLVKDIQRSQLNKLRRFQLSKPVLWKPYFHNLDWTGISFPTEKINRVWIKPEELRTVRIFCTDDRTVPLDFSFSEWTVVLRVVYGDDLSI
jgi:hypothetical protein